VRWVVYMVCWIGGLLDGCSGVEDMGRDTWGILSENYYRG